MLIAYILDPRVIYYFVTCWLLYSEEPYITLLNLLNEGFRLHSVSVCKLSWHNVQNVLCKRWVEVIIMFHPPIYIHRFSSLSDHWNAKWTRPTMAFETFRLGAYATSGPPRPKRPRSRTLYVHPSTAGGLELIN